MQEGSLQPTRPRALAMPSAGRRSCRQSLKSQRAQVPSAQAHSSMRTMLTHLHTLQGTSFICQHNSSKHASDMP